MSKCISAKGEYSEHAPGDEEFICGRCYVVDEEAMRDEIERLRADRPSVTRVGDTITTAEQYEAVRAWFFERGEYLIVRESWRPWIISEDQNGNAWAWSWLEEQGPDQREGEGPGGTVVAAEALRLPLTVLYVPGEPSRPSVTDDARAAEQRSEYTVQETAAYFARKVQRVSDRIRSTDYQRSVSDIVGLDSIQGFLDRVARDDLDMFAAGRAETTTATVEDAARAVAAWALDFAGIGVGIYLNGETIGDPNGPWDVPTDAADSLAAWLNQCGLLATARTRPTREELSALIMAHRWDPERWTCECGRSDLKHDNEFAEHLADAVLALTACCPLPKSGTHRWGATDTTKETS